MENSTIISSKPDLSREQKTYSRELVLTASLNYFNGDELAAGTWLGKYAMKDKSGNFYELTPDDMHHRMAKEFARIEDKYANETLVIKEGLSAYGAKRKKLNAEKIYSFFKDFKYIIPQGSVMSSLGNPFVIASLSNCIVLPEIHDSYGGIFYTDQQMAQLFKRRCGVGIDLSTLRPSGTLVSNAAGSTTGAVSFMERFSNTTREVAQNGRRGALMITMDIAHPDIEAFVTIKQDLSKITGANVSVRISDEFMDAVENNKKYSLRWPIESEEPLYTKDVNAKELWNTIVKCAHQTAEPGVIFWDRQHFYSTSSIYPGYKNVSTNPCSEIGMQGGDSCRLIALNFYHFITEPFTDKAKIDFQKLYETTYEAQRLMDDLVDLELEAIEKILHKVNQDPEPNTIKQVEMDTWKLLYENGKNGRRTGLGFTGLADAIAALGIKFDSDQSLYAIEQIMRCKCEAEFDSSIDMAIERGAFKGFNSKYEKQSHFVDMLRDEFPALYKRMMKFGRRNISISTVAPTGTLSLLAQTSSGIEPVFLTSYKRRKKVNAMDKDARIDFIDKLGDAWQEFIVYHPKIKNWMEISGETDETKSPYSGSTAPEIDWEKRVELQAIVQKYTTHSISSTINLPSTATLEDVSRIYVQSWKKGLKGITVYRDGSRSGVLIADTPKEQSEILESKPPKRPKSLEASVIRFNNHHEKWIGVIGLLNQKPYEIFTGRAIDAFEIPEWIEKGHVIKNISEDGKKRYDFQYKDKDGFKVTIEGLSRCFSKEYWNYAKLLSGVLRHGMPLPHVINIVENLNLDSDNINSWKVGVERALKKFIPDGTKAERKCSECGDESGLIYEEGCLKCKSCGHTKCG